VFTKVLSRQSACLPTGSRAIFLKRQEPDLHIGPIPYGSKAAEKLKYVLDFVCFLLFLAVVTMLLVVAVLPAEWF
jgi:hypothetical protein